MIKNFLIAPLFLVLLVNINLFAQEDCYQNIGGNLDGVINMSAIIDCPDGDVVLDNVGSHPSGSGNIIFDTDVTYNSLTINFVNGNKPAEFIIPAGVTVHIITDMTFTGQPSKEKFLTVEGTLIVGNTLNFGGIDMEIDGEGSITADEITGADDTSCSTDSGGTSTCPEIISDNCDDGGNGFCDSGDVLPIELLYFNSNIKNGAVELTWATASEENFDYFSIERSPDAADYEVIGTVPGHGWSDDIINYSYTDTYPLAGRAYYRLKATDLDGTFEYFTPLMVNMENGNKAVALTSNPVGEKPLRFRLNFKAEGKMMVKIVDITGTEVFSGTYEAGLSTYEVTKNFEKGLYLLKVSTGENVYTARFLKE